MNDLWGTIQALYKEFLKWLYYSHLGYMHDDVIKWKHFPRYWPFVRGIHRSPIFFYLRPNKKLSKQWWGWWFETPSCPLWRHRNGTAICASTRSLDAWKNESLCEELCVRACDMQCAARIVFRADSRFAPRQWETALLCNDVSHWLGASLKSAQVFILRYWLCSCTA